MSLAFFISLTMTYLALLGSLWIFTRRYINDQFKMFINLMKMRDDLKIEELQMRMAAMNNEIVRLTNRDQEYQKMIEEAKRFYRDPPEIPL